MSKIKNVAKYSVMITIILILSKFMGAFRDILFGYQFGVNREADIYKIATRIPNLFYSCVGAALTVTFIPIFSNVKNDKEKANRFFNNILNIISSLCIILSLLGIIFSKVLTKLMAHGFETSALSRTADLSIIVMPSIIFLTLSGLYTGYLQSYGKFLQPALTGISADFVLIAAILFFSRFGIGAVIVAFLLSSVIQMLIQRPFMPDYKYEFLIDFKDENVRKMLILAVPILITTAVGQINVIVDSSFASILPAGSVAIVDYAGRFSTIISQVFIFSITTVFYPMLTEKFTEKDMEGFETLFVKAVNVVMVVALPLIFGLATLSSPVVKLIFEHGKFTSQASATTSLCLKYLAFSAFGYSLMDILGKVFFSSKDTFTPMINGFILIGLNILLIITLVPRIGITGLALATTISSITVSMIMLVELKYKLKLHNKKLIKIAIVFIKALVSAAAMAIIVSFVYRITDSVIHTNSSAALGIKILVSTLAGVITYGIMLFILRVEELNTVINMKLKKKKNIDNKMERK